MKKQEKGITLIALVITIIVMLILTGVTISLLLDDDGIINKAKQAVAKQEQATAKEQEQLKNAALELELLTASSTDKTFTLTYIDEVPSDGGKIYDFLLKNDLTPNTSVVLTDSDDNKCISLEKTLMAEPVDKEGYLEAILNIPCEDENGKEVFALVTIHLKDDEKCEINNLEINILSELEKFITEINADILANPDDYKTKGTDNGDREEKWKARVIKLYSDNGLEILDGYLNEDKTDFTEKVILGEGASYSIITLTIPCEKDGEIIETVVHVRYLENLENAIVKFEIK